MSDTIQFIGLNELEEPEQDKVNLISQKYHEKIRRLIENIAPLAIHIKQYNKAGHVSKYSVHIKLAAPTRIFEAEKTEWDLNKAMHQSFEALINELNHYFGAEPKFMKRSAK